MTLLPRTLEMTPSWMNLTFCVITVSMISMLCRSPASHSIRSRVGGVTKWSKQQQKKYFSKLKLHPHIRADGLKLQSGPSVRHKRPSAAHRDGSASDGSRISKHPQSQRKRSAQTAGPTLPGGTKAARDSRERASVSQSSFIDDEQSELSGEDGDRSCEGDDKEKVDEIQRGMHRLSVFHQ